MYFLESLQSARNRGKRDGKEAAVEETYERRQPEKGRAFPGLLKTM